MVNIPVPVGEEVGPKLVRFLYFIGAGCKYRHFYGYVFLLSTLISVLIVCTAAINKWRDLEKKANIQKQHKELLKNSSPNSHGVQNAVE